MNWLKKLFGFKPTILFKSYIGNFAVSTPVVSAGKIRPEWMRKQTEKKVSVCPGMFDYFQSGYIITAHTDIHIKANRAGTVIQLAPTAADCHALKPVPFDFAVVEGMAKIDPAIKPMAFKIPMPWTVQAQEGYSAYVLPALMHADFLDKLHVYPGVVDYDKYHTINFVFSALKECEVTIYAGQPLLHVIPFKREKITAICGKATEEERDKQLFNMPTRMKHYYRKFLSERKSFAMSCPFDHRSQK
ncbi:hypothetical protein ACO0K3_03625 [Undibacterium sp. Rencai35W]|uniref:hypothetical protein n=1 Tax=Undibacterium sp. Rencai35W TaxID=3413046 RepID=UPI003BF2FB8A